MNSVKNKKETFEFHAENLKLASEIVKKYPLGKQRSAILPLLDMAQRQNGGWLPKSAIEYVANYLEIPFIRAMEVATFYTMFNLKPVGKYHIQVCGTTPCYLLGAEKIISACKKHLNIDCGELTKDGTFSLIEIECLGACVNAPVVQINDDYYENLDEKSLVSLLKSLKAKVK
jgi:NADH-quinone oxidoreductase E subunit